MRIASRWTRFLSGVSRISPDLGPSWSEPPSPGLEESPAGVQPMQVQRLDKGSGQPPFSPVLERELRLMELLLISLSCPKVAASVRVDS
jgi:hypothetical protein